jgi:hypothetical protein
MPLLTETSIWSMPTFAHANISHNIRLQNRRKIFQGWDNGIVSNAPNTSRVKIASFNTEEERITSEGQHDILAGVWETC